MAGTPPSDPAPSLGAIVDMGSNGIRFSITDLSPDTVRILPTLYQDRSGISLFDAQWSTGKKLPIPQNVISDVLKALLRFKSTCKEFGVANDLVHVIATEATRAATNSAEFRDAIKSATGWTVELLPKEFEGQIGAMGVASSFSSARGLVMDLGGGSTQITWVNSVNGDVQISDKGSVSLPYGAAALTQRLLTADSVPGQDGRLALKEEVVANLKAALEALSLPKELLSTEATLYLSGGGFRGWGFLLMHLSPISPYPIPIINGYRVPMATLNETKVAESTAAEVSVFGVSQRRVSQIPAIAFLVSALGDALPAITEACFCQGGVREGYLFSKLPKEIRAVPPLESATTPFRPKSSAKLLDFLLAAIPAEDMYTSFAPPGSPALPLLTALTNMLYYFTGLTKELRPACALRSTTTGFLAGVQGFSHFDRISLALVLCERWGGKEDLSDSDASFYETLKGIAGSSQFWWLKYVGKVAAVIGDVYPAGVVNDPLKIEAKWQLPESADSSKKKKKNNDDKTSIVIQLTVGSRNENARANIIDGLLDIAKMGKPKSRVAGVDVAIQVSLNGDDEKILKAESSP